MSPLKYAASLLGGTIVYLVVLGRVDAWSLLQGVLLSAAALVLTRRTRERVTSARGVWRLAKALPSLVVGQVLLGSWRVALCAAGLRTLPTPAVVAVPVGAEPAVSPAMLALLETLGPGSYLIDVDEREGVMHIHLFDEREADELRQRHAELLGGDEHDEGDRWRRFIKA